MAHIAHEQKLRSGATVKDNREGDCQEFTCRRRALRPVLKALLARFSLRLGFGYSKLFPARDEDFIRADQLASRRARFVQRLAPRAVILAALGVFFYFFATDNKVGLMSLLFLFPAAVIPGAALLGAFVTRQVDSAGVRVRRTYSRLHADEGNPRSVR